MKIYEVVDKLISYERGVDPFEPNKLLEHDTDRDKYLFGKERINNECTGIVTTCWANADVIKEAHKLNANLIIVHEALFWNHGDHTDWLEEHDNETFRLKKELLDRYGIVVRRDHDHIHSGIPVNDNWVDGIFYGFAKLLGWENYLETKLGVPVIFQLPGEKTASEIGEHLVKKFNLNGCRIEGRSDTKVKKLAILMHNLGDAKADITRIDKEKIDCVLGMELIDFTLAEYIRDSNMLGLNKAIVQIGHFNSEEAGMKYMAEWLPNVIGSDVPVTFVQSGDTYNYLVC